MACIILSGPLGERKIPENVPYQRLNGETIVGVDWTCAGQEQRSVEEELARQGIKWGDAVAWVTKKLGVQQCAPCKARQVIMNQGIAETVKHIRNGTFK